MSNDRSLWLDVEQFRHQANKKRKRQARLSGAIISGVGIVFALMTLIVSDIGHAVGFALGGFVLMTAGVMVAIWGAR